MTRLSGTVVVACRWLLELHRAALVAHAKSTFAA
jgi:hypothetical protein